VIVTRERRWAAVLLALFGASLAYAALGPADWQVRLGLHWLVEHFLGFFVLTLLACRVYPRPLRVAAVLLPVAVGLEAAQALTPDRTADVATALVAAAAVASAALLADAVLFWRKRREDV
jgi:peptidoglycan/LPS O-acetylase OafA/YrhL